MKLDRHEIALHEASHLLVHARVGTGYADKVWIGKATSGWVQSYDWSLTPEYGLNLQACVAAGGVAIEIIRGRNPMDYAAGDLRDLASLTGGQLSDDDKMSVVLTAKELLLKNWATVEFAAEFLLQHINGQGYVGKKACRKLFAVVRAQLI